MSQQIIDGAVSLQMRFAVAGDGFPVYDSETVSAASSADYYSYPNAATCPDCGAGMIRYGRCCSCPSCGFEGCGI